VIVRTRPAQALPYLLAFVLGLGAAGLAACGGKTNPAMIPASNASELRGHLDDVLSAIDSEDCTGAQRAIDQVRSDLQSLPSGTSQRLQDRLKEGADKLATQAAKECQATTTTATTATTTTTTIPTTTTETTTTDTVPTTTTTETTPPITTTTETTPPITTTTPPSDPGGVTTP
jgi:hypothetical protein